MPYYDRRDLIGHWITRQQHEGRPCTHACCRGYRVHPRRWPVIPANPTLHRATDDQLAAHFVKLSSDPSPQARYGEAQLLHEMERRDRAAERHAATLERRQRARQGRAEVRAGQRMEREAEAHRIRSELEAATSGYVVTAQGRARGISDAEVISGREDVFIRYATPEAKAFFAENPRPTAAYLTRGADTRVMYSDRGTRRARGRRARARALGWG